jgi:hypothetical protein
VGHICNEVASRDLEALDALAVLVEAPSAIRFAASRIAPSGRAASLEAT